MFHYKSGQKLIVTAEYDLEIKGVPKIDDVVTVNRHYLKEDGYWYAIDNTGHVYHHDHFKPYLEVVHKI